MTRKVPLAPIGHAIRRAIAKSKFGNRTDFVHAIRARYPEDKLSEKTLSRYENGENSPTVEQLERWALVLECDPAALLPSSRFAFQGSRVELDADTDVSWAASEAKLSDDLRRRLYDARHSIGPMERDQLLSAAMRLKKNADAGHLAFPKVRDGGEYVDEAPINDEAMLGG